MFSTLQLTNFFNKPEEVINKAKSATYYKSKDGQWPGVRSESLHIIYPELHNKIVSAVFANYYSYGEKINFRHARSYFHKIKPYSDKSANKGWIHKDNCILAGLIYLNKRFEPNTGTGMYIPNQDIDYKDSIDQKINLYLNGEHDEQSYQKTMIDMENQFTKVGEFQNIYNSFICYYGDNFHRIENFGSQERLTLVFFIDQISANGVPVERVRKALSQ